MKKFRLLLISFLLVGLVNIQTITAQDKWDKKTVATDFYSGSGTFSDPYTIRTGAQLSFFFSQLNAGLTYEGAYFRLLNDVDMSEKYCPTGTFSGDFDGAKHSITGLSREFIKKLSGSIHDLKIECSGDEPHAVDTITATGLMYNCYVDVYSGPYSLGYFAALAINNYGLISDCFATGRIHGNGEYGIGYHIAALVYQNYGTIRYCASQVRVIDYGGGDKSNVMVYSNMGTIQDCGWGTNSVTTMFDFTDATCKVEFIDLLHFTDDSFVERTKGQAIGFLPTPSYDCTFLGWYRNGVKVNSTDTINQNWTLFAKWEQRIKKQPSQKDMSIVVDDQSHASITWYRITQMPLNFSDWQSTNHARNTESLQTYTFSNCKGFTLSFQYDISSESFDHFIAKLNETVLVNRGGEVSDISSYIIPDNETYTLTLSYSKDESEDEGDDMVSVSNIKITPAPEFVLRNAFTLPAELLENNFIYYCIVSYSNTGINLNSDYIEIIEKEYESNTTLFASDLQTLVGSKVVLPIELTNEDEVKLCQFDLQLPNGVTVATKSNGKLDAKLTERAESHSVSSQHLSNGDYRFVVSSMDNDSFIGNEGTLMEITLDVAATMEAGEYTVKVLNVELSVPDGNDLMVVRPADTESILTVKSYTPGDVNNDGSVSVTDVGCAINYILEQVPTVFIFEAADMNGDKSVSVTDVGMIINLILNEGADSRTDGKGLETNYRNDHNSLDIIVPSVSLASTAEGYELMLENKDAFIGFQFDVEVAEGVSIGDVRLNGVGESDHVVTYSLLQRLEALPTIPQSLEASPTNGNRRWRVVCYSPTNSVFTADNAPLLTISVVGEASKLCSTATISNIRLTTAGFDELHPANLTYMPTDIASINKDMQMSIEGGTLRVTSDCETTLRLYSLDGSTYRALQVRKGRNSFDGLRKGIYMINNQKVIIR